MSIIEFVVLEINMLCMLKEEIKKERKKERTRKRKRETKSTIRFEKTKKDLERMDARE